MTRRRRAWTNPGVVGRGRERLRRTRAIAAPATRSRARRESGLPAHPGPARDLAHQAREGDDAHAEDRAGRGQLAAVVVDVGERRHDEDRLLVERGAVGAQDEAGLLGVGGTGDEGEWHGVPQGCSWTGGSGRHRRFGMLGGQRLGDADARRATNLRAG